MSEEGSAVATTHQTAPTNHPEPRNESTKHTLAPTHLLLALLAVQLVLKLLQTLHRTAAPRLILLHLLDSGGAGGYEVTLTRVLL